MVLVIAGVGLALILGLIRGRTALSVLGMVVLVLLAGPFIEALIAALPSWVILLLVLFVALALFRGVLSLLLGERASGHAVGILAADVIRLCFGLLFLPFRILWWAFRRA
jgi:prepilin signal peptidase PulO-like enzyme (type II secretory pathway)